MASVPPSLRQQVILDANQCCEYCQTQQCLTGMPLVIDHIIPRSMGGGGDRANLAASCYRCNEFKGVKMNNKYVVESRRIWVAENWHPPNF